MKVSDQGLEELAKNEGLRLKAYPDPGSKDGTPWTIGYGHTAGVKSRDTCTPAQALRWLQTDVGTAENTVNTYVKAQLSQHQFDALVDFVFNIGLEQFLSSTLLRKLNKWDFEGAALEFAKWKYNDGKVSLGLVNRRKAETKWFNTKD